jgi:hypothetical protein
MTRLTNSDPHRQPQRLPQHRRPGPRLVRGLAAAAVLFTTWQAAAQSETGLAACGNIDVRAEAECEVLIEGGCTVQCEPARFELACQGECTGDCSVSVTAECSAACTADCRAVCEVEPGEFDCRGECGARCSGNCAASCETNDDSNCRAACEGQCDVRCDASCEVTPPQAQCEAKCEASCEGSCRADANANCYVSCEGSCVAELEGGCEAQCQKPEGALFCDGQYVDTGNNLDECVTALRRALDIEVEGYAQGSGSCMAGECTAQGEAGCTCSMGRSSSPTAPLVGGVGMLFLGGWVRRARQRARRR